jgi:hypothetical protein
VRADRVERRAARHAAKGDKKRALATAHLSAVPAGEPATPQARGYESCPCPKDCTLQGECLLCVAYHGRKDALPRCLR